MATGVRELTDLPPCEPGLSMGGVAMAGGVAFVVYETPAVDPDEAECAYGVLRLDGCDLVAKDGPNDEAFRNHPHFALGLQWYALQEIVESPLVRDRAQVRDLHGSSGTVWRSIAEGRRHFVFAFKENTVEVVAKSCVCVGTYSTEAEAQRVVRDALVAAMQ